MLRMIFMVGLLGLFFSLRAQLLVEEYPNRHHHLFAASHFTLAKHALEPFNTPASNKSSTTEGSYHNLGYVQFISPILGAYPGSEPSSPSLLIPKDHLAFFCRIELHLEKAANIPIKFRLGSVDYVDRLEGKRDW
ncbi:MAG: hypothetical protein AAGF87_13060 [Bacteroidota bacterium]